MKPLRFKSIRTRLIFWFLFLALIPLTVGILITFNQHKQTIEQETFEKLTAIRDLKVQQLEAWLDARMGDVQVMAGDFEIRGLEHIFDKKEKSAKDIEKIEIARELLNRNLSNYDDYEEIFIIGANTGLIEISTTQGFIGNKKSQNLYFTVPLETGEIYIKDIYYSKILNRPQMTISLPIYCLEHNKHIIGILVARIDLENSLYNLLANRIGLGETGETLIVNKDVVALNELRWYNNAPLNLHISAEPAVNAAQGKTDITITKDYRGEDILAAYTYISETGWGLVCKQDLYELNAPIREMVLIFIIIFIITSIVIALIAFSISKSISKPIVDLNTIAQKIGTGDLSVRNTFTSNDELGSLAMELNNMADMTESRIKIQKGVSDISEIMIGQTSMQEFGSNMLKQLMEITRANMSTFYILNEATSEYEHFVSVGANEELLKPFNARNPEGEIGNAISKKKIYYLRDIPEDTIFKFKTTAGDANPREIITIPVLAENIVVALISLVNIHRFSKECYDILNQSWTGINTSYSNLIANERTRVFADQLSRTNQQLEAQTEELKDQAEELQDQAEELHRASKELQEQNLELDAQKKQVEAANKLKSEFLSNMSHELRTPLNSIMALSRVLIMQAKDKLNDEENSYLEIVERNGKNLLLLINDILDLSKIEAGKMEIMPNRISVGSLLRTVKENLQSLADDKDLTLIFSVTENLPKVETDESRLHQVLTNIISNAIKFTEKGSVKISVNHDSENVSIEIKDTGIVISKEALPNIFDEFIQADGTSSRQYEGTGLGLTIANKMTNILGGNIKVNSKLGKGSVFIITIPVKWHEDIVNTGAPNIDTAWLESQDNTIFEVDNERKHFKDISKPHVLIVEDNQDAIIQIKTVLENENYKVDVASSGQEALDYFQHTIPDGIILDLMMPDVDGFEVLEKLRSTEETKNIPVLILTAKDLTHKDLARLSENNIQQLIQKGDVDIEGLLYKLEIMLGNRPVLKSQPEPRNPQPATGKWQPQQKNETDLPNILVVEDNPDNMTTIKAILKGKYNIVEAIDGEQGLMMAQLHMPDLILLDMALPKMDGEEIVQILKGNNETKNIMVIAVTAQAMKGDKERLLEVGCDGYVPKPVDPEALLGEIGRLLRK